MASLESIVETLNEKILSEAQQNVEVMRNEEGHEVHVRMIAYDDLI